MGAKPIVEPSRKELLAQRNVFQTDDEMTPLQKLKLVLGLIFLFIPRIIFLMTAFILHIIFQFPVLWGYDLTQPLPRKVLARVGWLNWAASVAFRITFGIVLNVKGTPCPIEETQLQVCGPHLSWLDGFIVGMANGGLLPSYVAKAEVVNSAFTRVLFSSIQLLAVDRMSSKSRHLAATNLTDRAMNSKWNRKITLFPEGTCGNGTAVMKFNTGAFTPGVPLQPLVIRFQDELAWTIGSKSRTRLMLRSFCQLYREVEVEFLPVYIPTQEEKDHPEFYAESLRNIFATELNLPLADATFVDRQLARQCGKSKVDVGRVLDFYFDDFLKTIQNETNRKPSKELYKLTKIEVQNLLTLFLSFCDKKTGLISKSQWSEMQKCNSKSQKKFTRDLTDLKAKENLEVLRSMKLDETKDNYPFRELLDEFYARK